MMADELNGERSKFEAALKKLCESVDEPVGDEDLAVTPSGEYIDEGTWVAWTFWKALASLEAGWKLVPIEPTQAMLDAVVTTMDDFLLGKEAEKQYREDWAAMIAAAPSHPASI